MNSFKEAQLEPDEQLEQIADATRRNLLFALLDDTPGDTSIQITEGVGDVGTAEVIEMQHVHLPKLADRDLVHWDRESQLVTQGPQFGGIEPLLTVLYEHADELPADWL